MTPPRHPSVPLAFPDVATILKQAYVMRKPKNPSTIPSRLEPTNLPSTPRRKLQNTRTLLHKPLRPRPHPRFPPPTLIKRPLRPSPPPLPFLIDLDTKVNGNRNLKYRKKVLEKCSFQPADIPKIVPGLILWLKPEDIILPGTYLGDIRKGALDHPVIVVSISNNPDLSPTPIFEIAIVTTAEKIPLLALTEHRGQPFRTRGAALKALRKIRIADPRTPYAEDCLKLRGNRCLPTRNSYVNSFRTYSVGLGALYWFKRSLRAPLCLEKASLETLANQVRIHKEIRQRENEILENMGEEERKIYELRFLEHNKVKIERSKWLLKTRLKWEALQKKGKGKKNGFIRLIERKRVALEEKEKDQRKERIKEKQKLRVTSEMQTVREKLLKMGIKITS